jgi:hypothetical protein
VYPHDPTRDDRLLARGTLLACGTTTGSGGHATGRGTTQPTHAGLAWAAGTV